ncbi:MAG: putative sulfite reductase [ferredoxin] [Candidatus Hydrogenedentota bacterium]
MTPDESQEPKLSAVEGMKAASRGLRGTLLDDLENPSPSFCEESTQLMKHHGSYQQDDRDTRTERKKAKLDKDYKMMLRTKFPGGRISAEQYLICDDLADRYGQGDLRVTSRQDFQFHGVVKRNLRPLIHELNKLAEITTLGGCGDVVRNTMAAAVSDIDLRYKDCGADLIEISEEISRYFMPTTGAYFDLWLDDEKVTVNSDGTVTFKDRGPAEAEPDPIYGKTYLPRKFKIGLATDFDNSVDVYTQDVGIIAVTEHGRIVGYEILAGGGLGYTHRKAGTYPRLGTHLAFVSREELLPVLEAIVKVQRDFGGRADRKHARLKYLMDDIGLDAFRAKVFEYAGRTFDAPRNVVPDSQPDYLGWHKQIQSGLNYVGVWIENGRIRDFENGFRFRTGLRAIVEKFRPQVRLTPHHNAILSGIRDDDVAEVQRLLDEYGIPTDKGITAIRRMEMACPALPLCGLAMSEAERALPGVIAAVEEAGHGDADVMIRMSGCPNNCSRPRTAEIGIVGFGANQYVLYTGGDFNGTRLNEVFNEKVKAEELPGLLNALLAAWKSERGEGERFGDWSHRVGVEELQSKLGAPTAHHQE